MYYLPQGSMMQLMDGRVLHKDNKTNQWRDNMGVPITEQQLQFMLQHPTFDYDSDNGQDHTLALNAALANIGVTLANTETFNANRSLIIGASRQPQTLVVSFAAGGTYASLNGSTFTAYRNDVGITSIGITNGVVPSNLNIGQFTNGDQLKFSLLVPSATGNTLDFNATVTGQPQVTTLGSFRVFTNF